MIATKRQPGFNGKNVTHLAASGLLGALLAVSTAHAGVIDFSVGGGAWRATPSGMVRYNVGASTGSDVDLKGDLGLTAKTQGYLWADLEHPISLLPNVRVEYANLKTSGAKVLNRAIVYGGSTFAASTRVVSDNSVKQSDLILYYAPLNNWVKLDLGLDVKYLDTQFRLSDGGSTTQAKGSTVVPMLYGNVSFQIPATSLSLGVAGSFIGYGGSSLSDLRARAAYLIGGHLGIEGGYRRVRLKIDSSSIDPNGDIRFDGAYVGVFAAL